MLLKAQIEDAEELAKLRAKTGTKSLKEMIKM